MLVKEDIGLAVPYVVGESNSLELVNDGGLKNRNGKRQDVLYTQKGCQDMQPTGEQLWKWAHKIALNSEYKGFGTKYPTVREAARRFKCKQSEIAEATEDDMYPHDRYLGVACWNTVVPEPLGNYVVEAY